MEIKTLSFMTTPQPTELSKAIEEAKQQHPETWHICIINWLWNERQTAAKRTEELERENAMLQSELTRLENHIEGGSM